MGSAAKLNQETLNVLSRVGRDVHSTKKFVDGYLKSREGGNNIVAAYDSLDVGTVTKGQIVIGGFGELPTGLNHILTHSLFDSQDAQETFFEGLEHGINQYKSRNGGEMPAYELITAAIDGASKLLSEFDSLSAEHSESLAVVPALTSVTVATRIASGLPFISQLPNPFGSNEVPFVVAAITADSNYLGLNQGDRIDGSKSSLSYIRNKNLFLMVDQSTVSTSGITTPGTNFAIIPRTAYSDPINFVPLSTAQAAPIVGGRVTIRVNGVAVANDTTLNHPTTSGTSILQNLNAIVNGVEVDIATGSSASLDTSLINAVFAEAIPSGAVVHAEVVFDFERKSPNGPYPLLQPPMTSVKTWLQNILAFPSRGQSYVSIDAQTQMMNEMNLSPQALMVGMLQQKYYLEDNIALFRIAYLQARSAGRVLSFDYNRGSSVTPAYNSQAEGISYIKPTIELAGLNIRNLTLDNGVIDVLASDNAMILLKQMGIMFGFQDVPGAVTNSGAVTRVGQWSNGSNLYHVPSQSQLLPEGASTATIMIIARGTQPQFNPFVGMTAVPPMTLELKNRAFEEGVGFYCRMASDVNPHPLYAQGVYLIDLINLPLLGD